LSAKFVSCSGEGDAAGKGVMGGVRAQVRGSDGARSTLRADEFQREIAALTQYGR